MYDITIIGGGINGAGIAAQAASCGLSVLLCEQGDIASGTSFASSKLIHGGLRYLEYLHFGLVKKALREREILLHKAPHLVKPMQFVVPLNSSERPMWMVSLGLMLYDFLAPKKKLFPSKKIDLRQDEILLPNVIQGFSYSDCMTDDARLVVTNALAAAEQGAKILTYTSFISAKRFSSHWEIKLKDTVTGEESKQETRMLINVSGAWVDEVSQKITLHHPCNTIKKIKGSHLVFPKLYEGNHAYLLQNKDKRVIFVIPFHQHYHLVGTTETVYSDPLEQIKVTPEEREYLCDSVNRYFCKPINIEKIVWEYAGVRALKADDKKKASQTSREYTFSIDKVAAPLLTVTGGKLTTFRILAEDAFKLIAPFFPSANYVSTEGSFLPGGDIGTSGFDQFSYAAHKYFAWLPREIIMRMVNAYGSRLYQLLAQKNSLDDMGEHFGQGLYQAEVDYLCQYEWARTSEDILWRRSKLGLLFTAQEVKKLDQYLKKGK